MEDFTKAVVKNMEISLIYEGKYFCEFIYRSLFLIQVKMDSGVAQLSVRGLGLCYDESIDIPSGELGESLTAVNKRIDQSCNRLLELKKK